jgi:hypothetical protein
VSGAVVDACLTASTQPLDTGDANAQPLPLAA